VDGRVEEGEESEQAAELDEPAEARKELRRGVMASEMTSRFKAVLPVENSMRPVGSGPRLLVTAP
jgi:hypothetical protein